MGNLWKPFLQEIVTSLKMFSENIKFGGCPDMSNSVIPLSFFLPYQRLIGHNFLLMKSEYVFCVFSLSILRLDSALKFQTSTLRGVALQFCSKREGGMEEIDGGLIGT